MLWCLSVISHFTFSSRCSLSLSWSWRSLVFFPTSNPPVPKLKKRCNNQKLKKTMTNIYIYIFLHQSHPKPKVSVVKFHFSDLLDWTSSTICVRISKRSSNWATKRKQTHVLRPRHWSFHRLKQKQLWISQLVKTPANGTFSVWSLRCSWARTWFFQLAIVIKTNMSHGHNKFPEAASLINLLLTVDISRRRNDYLHASCILSFSTGIACLKQSFSAPPCSVVSLYRLTTNPCL